ncbi:MAG: HypC/HybG/HupF family hydrogenase formation chaperone [Thermoanaerobaculia bacterium]
MCLAIPGKVLKVEGPADLPTGTVQFGGITKEVSLVYVPDVVPGEYVLVHVGFALSKIDEEEAKRVFEYLSEMEGIEGMMEELRAFRE